MTSETFRDMLSLLRRLQEAKIAFSLRQSRDDALMIAVNVPGERWEIEFVDYDDEVHVEIERFRSDGHIANESALEELFGKYSDRADERASEGNGKGEATPKAVPSLGRKRNKKSKTGNA